MIAMLRFTMPLLAISGVLSSCVFAQKFVANYDEAKVPTYELPDPLKLPDGGVVEDAQTWWEVRRPQIFKLFEEQVYGRAPGSPSSMAYRLLEEADDALDGAAIRKQVRVLFDGTADGPHMDILIYLPAEAEEAVPLFLGLNFRGNHAIRGESEILMTSSWQKRKSPRGAAASRWSIDRCLSRGYGVATIYCGDIDPDHDDGFANGVHPMFYAKGQDRPAADEWGSIAAWAWGLSRALDYCETDSQIDHERVAVFGHSRLGKTAIWAGARDSRFAMVISNNSGCGGAALSRRCFGETVGRINKSFPHWFCDNFNQYSNHESALPVDQHMLVALIAPRPVYIASATKDIWADPRGEFLAALHGDPVYELLGVEGLGVEVMPGADAPVHGGIGYHLRSGKHDVTDYDWQQYLAFADKHLSR